MKDNRTMTNDEIKELALSLAYANKEADVVKILEKAGLWNNKAAWEEFCDESKVGNQSSPANALMEKITNSVDAVLMRDCLKQGIDPESKQAPQSMKEAQKKLLGIRDGNLFNDRWSRHDRSKFAKDNISFVATGSKTKPCFTIIDTGEGQLPSNFKNSFLKETKSNKQKIPFVQGKFGMGGTGAIAYSSEKHNLQLIISKRCKFKESDPDSQWGFTVTRIAEGSENNKVAIYEYLLNPHSEKQGVFSFDADTLPLLPQEQGYGDGWKYGKSMTHGSFVKLYDYRINGKRHLSSHGLTALWKRFELLAPDIAVPVNMVEGRKLIEKFNTRTLAGFIDKIISQKEKFLEKNISPRKKLLVEKEEIDCQIFLLKPSETKKRKRDVDGVIFTLNGQYHGALPRRFFKTNRVELRLLSEDIFVFLETKGMSKVGRRNILKADREGLKDTKFLEKIKQELADFMRDHPALKEAEEERFWAKKGNTQGNKSKSLEDFMENNADLMEFINSTSSILNIPGAFSGGKESYKGKRYPTFFRLKDDKKGNRFTDEKPKEQPFNRDKLVLKYETDADNDYFEDKIGKCGVEINGEKIEGGSIDYLWDGEATLRLNLQKQFKIGEKITVTLKVTDDNCIEPFVIPACIIITKREQTPVPPTPPVSPVPPENNDGFKGNFPDVEEVREKQSEEWDGAIWSDHDMDGRSALKCTVSGDKIMYHINMDNQHLKKEILRDKNSSKELLEDQFKTCMVFMGHFMLCKLRHEEKAESSETDIEPENKVEEYTKHLAPVILRLINNKWTITKDDVADEDDDEE